MVTPTSYRGTCRKQPKSLAPSLPGQQWAHNTKSELQNHYSCYYVIWDGIEHFHFLPILNILTAQLPDI